jgi:hypothetical protein
VTGTSSVRKGNDVQDCSQAATECAKANVLRLLVPPRHRLLHHHEFLFSPPLSLMLHPTYEFDKQRAQRQRRALSGSSADDSTSAICFADEGCVVVVMIVGRRGRVKSKAARKETTLSC